MKIAVIGAGGAGLAALRQCTDKDNPQISVVCYEKNDQIGGTWVYDPQVGVNRYNLPIHTSMYKNLRTNLPKEVMGFPDYQIPESPKSYLSRVEILEFLNSYCDHFKLRDKIKLLHNVESIEPVENTDTNSCQRSPFKECNPKWKLQVRDLQSQKVIEETFDAVMICNGHYFQPRIPYIKGYTTEFKGLRIHSHDYREPDVFRDKTVAILGAGPSGMDLALDISKTAKRVFLSHHLPDPILTKFPSNVIQKTDVVEFGKDKAIFSDGTEEKIDAVLLCSGYEYSFPFLRKTSGVQVDSNMVTPLWKHLISIENPTLAFVGLPFYVCAFSMFDLQVRFVLRFWKHEKTLPSKEKMLADENKEKEEKTKLGLFKRHFHMMGPAQGDYYKELAEIGDITPLPPVLTKLHNESSKRFLDDLVHYREDVYKILDNENFIQAS